MAKWMAEAFSNRGALHRQLGVPEDQPIPQSKLTAAKNKARRQIEAAEGKGRKAPASAVKTSRRVALAQRAKSGDIHRMQTGGLVQRITRGTPPAAPAGMAGGAVGAIGGAARKPRNPRAQPTPPAGPYRMEAGGVVTQAQTQPRARDLVLEGLKE